MTSEVEAVALAIELLEKTPIGDIGSNRRPVRTWEQKQADAEQALVGLRAAIAAMQSRPDVDGLVEALGGIAAMLSGYAGQPNLMGDIFKIADAALSPRLSSDAE